VEWSADVDLVHRGAAHSAESGVDQVNDGLQGDRVSDQQVLRQQRLLLPCPSRQ